jgi:hypothetical protein
MDISNYALTVYVTTEVVNLSAIAIDYLLIKASLPSITEVSTKYPVIGAVVILFQTISPLSLGLHFWYFPRSITPNRI